MAYGRTSIGGLEMRQPDLGGELTGRGEGVACVVSRCREAADWERGEEGARGEPLES